MERLQRSKNHHWWPVGLQSHWADRTGNVSWIEPDGSIHNKRAANRKIAFKIHGHTIFRGSGWESNFEAEFDVDNNIHMVISSLNKLKPLGRTPSELLMLMKLLFKKNRTLRDLCKFYDLDEKLHRSLLLLIYSLLIRSPANRSRYEGYSKIIGLPPDEEVGKANMIQNYRAAKRICERNLISNQYFVLLHSPIKRFTFGDGSLDWLTYNLVGNQIRGKTLIPLTPHLCIYFCTPMDMRSSPNCASLSVASWMVDWINDITQIYSKDKIFFLGKAPSLSDAFRQGKFLEHKVKTDGLIDQLDEIVNTKRWRSSFSIDAN